MSLLTMLVQIGNVAKRLEAESTLVQAGPRVGRHVFVHGEPHGESLSANLALERPGIDRGRARVGPVTHHMELRAELLAAHVAVHRISDRVDHLHVFGQARPTAHLLAAQFTLDRLAQIGVVFTLVRLQPTTSFEHFRALFAHELLVRVRRPFVSAEGLFAESENN